MEQLSTNEMFKVILNRLDKELIAIDNDILNSQNKRDYIQLKEFAEKADVLKNIVQGVKTLSAQYDTYFPCKTKNVSNINKNMVGTTWSSNVPLVFSRKGFDSSSSGGYSPYDPETGKYIVLPIPDGEINNYYGNKITYDEINIRKNYFDSIDADNLKELIEGYSLSYSNRTKNLINTRYAHFDPMLGECPWLETNKYQMGAFGQSSGAQGELKNKGVGPGSIFLFFARFRPIQNRKNNMGFNVYEGGCYFIYGWMRVGKVYSKYDDIDDNLVKEYHPHATQEYFINSNQNTIYAAADKLFNDSDIPGCGYFPVLNKKLLLTDTNHMDKPWFWRLPSCFSKSGFVPSHFEKNKQWVTCNDKDMLVVESPANRTGQEFITQLCKESENWLRSLF